MDVPERSNRTGRSFAPVTTIFYRLDRKSLASLMRGAPPEYLSLADTSQRLSKLCQRQFIFKQTVSFRDTTNFYSNTSSPAFPLGSAPAVHAPIQSAFFRNAKIRGQFPRIFFYRFRSRNPTHHPACNR